MNEASVRAPLSNSGLLTDLARRDLAYFTALMAVLNLAVPLATYFYADLTGRDIARAFWSERNALTWFSSVQLVLVGMLAYLNYRAGAALNRLSEEMMARRRWIWLIFALGFVFLGLDERFEIHEGIRNDILRPDDLFSDIPFIRPGDIVLYLYLGVGLVFATVLFAELRRFPPALALFGLALLTSASVVVLDALPKAITEAWPIAEHWLDIYEEVAEIWAQFFFLLSFVTLLRARLQRIGSLPERPVPT